MPNLVTVQMRLLQKFDELSGHERSFGRILDLSRPIIRSNGALYLLADLAKILSTDYAIVYGARDKDMDQLCRELQVETLVFKDMQVQDLTPLRSVRTLRHLKIDYNRKIVDLDKIADIAQLTSLVLEDCSKVRDLAPLAHLTGLKALRITGNLGSLSPKADLETLTPILQLPALEELSLLNLRIERDGLKPLAGCRALQTLQLPNMFATSDYAYLKAKLGQVDCAMLAPFVKLDKPLTGTNKDVMIVGRGKPLLSMSADSGKVAAYIRAFDDMVLAASGH